MVGESDSGFTVYLGEMLGKSQAEESVELLVVLMEQLDDEILYISADGGIAGICAGLSIIISGAIVGRQLLRSGEKWMGSMFWHAISRVNDLV